MTFCCADTVHRHTRVSQPPNFLYLWCSNIFYEFHLYATTFSCSSASSFILFLNQFSILNVQNTPFRSVEVRWRATTVANETGQVLVNITIKCFACQLGPVIVNVQHDNLWPFGVKSAKYSATGTIKWSLRCDTLQIDFNKRLATPSVQFFTWATSFTLSCLTCRIIYCRQKRNQNWLSNLVLSITHGPCSLSTRYCWT